MPGPQIGLRVNQGSGEARIVGVDNESAPVLSDQDEESACCRYLPCLIGCLAWGVEAVEHLGSPAVGKVSLLKGSW